MLIGLSMLPAYYKERLNLFVALAPVARLDHTPIKFLKFLAENLDFFKFLLIDVFKMYNFLGPSEMDNEFGGLCTYLPLICDSFF